MQKPVEPKPIYKASTTIISQPTARQRRKKRVLPQVLQGLMGEANVKFAKGEVEIAEQMCMEIIRQVFNVFIVLIFTSRVSFSWNRVVKIPYFFFIKVHGDKNRYFLEKTGKNFSKNDKIYLIH